jgi:hypothetical protein
MIFPQVIYRKSGYHPQTKWRRIELRTTSSAPDANMILQSRRALAWAVLLFLLTVASYLSFRAYLSPEFLIGFANLFSC